jgi:glyoxylase-like metal-dependent hydrolase (beta-lactamase superfamily II)
MSCSSHPIADGVFSISLGAVRITTLLDGMLAAPVANHYRSASGAPTPEAFPDAPDRLSVNVFLVEVAGRHVLIDSGSGELFGPDHGKLPDRLATIGLSPADIDDVIITHMHADHVGGLTIGGKPLFSKAGIHAGETEAAFWLAEGAIARPGVTERVKGQIARAHAMLDPYKAQGRLFRFADHATDIVAGFDARLHPGHTPGHLTIGIGTGDSRILFVGDIVHGDKVQFRDPAVTIDFDYDQATAAPSRRAVFEEAADQHFLIAGAHLPFPGIGRVERNAEGFRFMPA